MRRAYSGVGAALLVMAIAAGPAAAIQSKCLAGKTKCVSKEAFSLIKCEWKARTPGRPNDPNAGGCIDKATAVFDGGALPDKGCFEKLENVATNDCVSFDDTQAAQTLIDQCVASVVSTIDPMLPDQTKCNVGKHKCAAKKLKGLLKCHFKATTPGKPEDPNTDGCIDKVLAKFDGGADPSKGCVVKLENSPRSDCTAPIGNQADIEAAVDGCVDSIVNALQTPSSTTTTTLGTTSSTIGATTTTTAPTGSTTSTSSPTSSTTTTSTPGGGASCSATGLTATVGLDYNEQILGGVSAIHVRLTYAPPLVIPGTGTSATVRARVTNLAGAGSTLSGINDRDLNTDTVDETLDADSRKTTGSLSPGPLFRVLYDCPNGTPIPPSAITCVLSQATDLSGFPFPPAQAALIGCTVALSPAP